MERDISGLAIDIDRTLCIGSGNCVNLAAEIFELDEQNLVRFREETPDIDPERLKEACALSTPFGCMTETSSSCRRREHRPLPSRTTEGAGNPQGG